MASALESGHLNPNFNRISILYKVIADLFMKLRILPELQIHVIPNKLFKKSVD